MIASRNVDRLKAAVDEMRSLIPADSSACIEYQQCNVRKEDQVGFNIGKYGWKMKDENER